MFKTTYSFKDQELHAHTDYTNQASLNYIVYFWT